MRPFIGIFVNAFIGNKFNSKKSWYNFKGRIEGYFFKFN